MWCWVYMVCKAGICDWYVSCVCVWYVPVCVLLCVYGVCLWCVCACAHASLDKNQLLNHHSAFLEPACAFRVYPIILVSQANRLPLESTVRGLTAGSLLSKDPSPFLLMVYGPILKWLRAAGELKMNLRFEAAQGSAITSCL